MPGIPYQVIIMFNRTLAALALATALSFLTLHAFAATAPVVSDTVAVTTPAATAIPYGDWIAGLLAWARDGIVAGVGVIVIRFAPVAVRQYLTNQVLAHAVDYALARVEGAERGKTLNLDIASAVMREAVAYAVNNAPTLATRLGDSLRPKLLARISAVANVAQPPVATAIPLPPAA